MQVAAVLFKVEGVATSQYIVSLKRESATILHAQVHQTPAAFGVRERLAKLWQQHALAGAASSGFVSPQQQALFALCASYRDVLCTARPGPCR